MSTTRGSRRYRTATVVAGGLLGVVLLAGPAGAQDPNDPYGSTTTTTAPPATATIELSVDSGPRGTDIGVFACGYAPGTTGGSVTFDGTVVASGLVASAQGCLTGTGNAPPGSAPLTIRVPDDARPGNRNVCSVVSGYNTPCAQFQVRNQGEAEGGVLGNRITNDSLFGGSLPKTGLAIGALLAIAAVLIVGGRALLADERRRRRTAQ